MKKKVLMFFMLMLLMLTSCKSRPFVRTSENGFYYKIEDGHARLGDICGNERDEYIFLPSYVDNYPVKELGFEPPFMSVVGDNCIKRKGDGDTGVYLEKVYIPASVNEINKNYIYSDNHPTYFFYCGQIIDLVNLGKKFKHSILPQVIIYVPKREFDEFLELYTAEDISNLKPGNVYYDLNYPDCTKYYIDYCENGSLIECIPPNPTRNRYFFAGWYKEIECTNQWDFSVDKITNQEEELILYAKWEKVNRLINVGKNVSSII